MYNPSRGGVRGGADQFTWESVKSDKHRENYLGHSLKAPVGRWQKGKDLSWYAKERKDGEDGVKSEKSHIAAIKRAEEEAMMIALGQKVVRKENQTLSKEEMKEALRRNIGERDDLNIERVDGVGALSRRALMMTGIGKTSSNLKNEGVLFESQKGHHRTSEDSPNRKKSKSKKKSKKSKKEKRNKRSEDTSDSEESPSEHVSRKKHKKHKKKSTYEQKSSSDSGGDYHKSCHKKHKSHHSSPHPKRKRHDTSESD